jgi:hypothetical protein
MKRVAAIATICVFLVTIGVLSKIKRLPYQSGNVALTTRGDHKPDIAIEGRVINAAGQAVGAAKVFAELDNGGLTSISTGLSDPNGDFTIKVRELGHYTVFGSKEEEGYPLTVSGFHQQVSLAQIPKLNITEEKDITNVVLQLGEPVGRIKGAIKDAGTGQSIKKTTMTLRRSDNPELVYRTSTGEDGTFDVVVPPVPITLEVESPGYKNWSYSNDGSERSQTLRLNRGETHNLQIALHKR